MKSLNKKIKSLFLLISFAAYMPISIAPSFAAVADNTTPVLDSSINGGNVGINGSINVGGKDYNNFEVNMAEGAGKGGVGLFDWGSFDVGKNVAVNWIFNANGQKAINRVMNTGKASEIYGALTSSCAGNCSYAKTSSVILINPNGIMFGQGSMVNLGSFTASTMDINGLEKAKQDFINGKVPTIKTGKRADGSTFTYNSYGKTDVLRTQFGNGVPITFDRSHVDSNGNGVITLDGAKFNVEGFTNGEPKTQATSVALIADKIDIKNKSTIQTYEDPNKNGNFGNGYARSNVKLITADGVTLSYGDWGQVSEADAAGNSLVHIQEKTVAAGEEGKYGISISGGSQIYSGSVQVENKVKNAKVSINNSTLWGRKLNNATTGEISVKSSGDIEIVNSRLETMKGAASDAANPEKSNAYGNITILADKNITIDNTRIYSAPSDLNNGLANGADAKAGNILIKSKEGNINIKKSAEALAEGNSQVGNLPINIVSYGNLRLEADYGTVKTDFTKGGYTKIAGKYNTSIGAKNIELNGGAYGSQQGNLTLRAGTLVKNPNTGLMDILGGGIKINDSVLQASRGELAIQGLETTLANATLDYNTLSFYNDYYLKNNLNHDVLIKDGTTFFDRQVESGAKDTLVLETTGQLILDHNKLQKADFDDTRDQMIATAADQTSNVKLSSLNSQVSIRNNSDVKVSGNIELNGKTNANVSTSDVTSKNGNITMIGGTKVTLGDAIDQIAGDKNVITKKGSTLNAANGNITLTAKGDVKDPTATQDIRGITILNSKLNAKNNTLTANNGDVSIQTSTITATTGNNKITADNARVGIQQGSNVIAANQSDIVAKNNVIITNSTVKSSKKNNITSQTNKVTVKGTGALVQSTGSDVVINQALTANTDTDFDQAQGIKAAGNIYLNVKGNGQNINRNGTVGSFAAGNRLVLNANNDINLTKAGDWTINRTDFIAGNNTNISSTNVTLNNTTFDSKNNNITAKGNVTINNNMDINKGKTTIKSNGNVKTNASNGVINTNSNKLIVNADKDIDIAFTGVNNKTAGLEINSDVNTSNGNVLASEGNAALAGRNVKLNAKDKTLSIAKIKADTLEIVDANNTKLIAATDNKPNSATDNIGPNSGSANVGTAYIEIRKLAGWNMDTDVENIENVPGFYQENYDKANDGNHQRHFIQFNNEGSNENFLLVYQRATEGCEEPEVPGDNGTISNVGINESALVRLPRHEEGVSAVAPVLNEITDPTANVIMAAARITLDEENEDDEEGAF